MVLNKLVNQKGFNLLKLAEGEKRKGNYYIFASIQLKGGLN